MKFKILKTLFIFIAFTSLTEAYSAAIHLSVQYPRGKREIGVGDLFYITFDVSNTETAPAKPEDVPGAKVMYFDRTGQSSSFTSVNGKTTQSYSFSYTLTLRAKKEGSYTFGPVTVDGIKSNTVNYTIGTASAPSFPGGNSQQDQQPSASGRHDNSNGPKFIGKGDGNLFLRAEISKSNAYEQEALVYTVKLYTTYDAIKFIGATSAPKFDGFVVEESKDVANQLTYETYGGKSYATAIIARYIIFPQMEGYLKVTGNTYTVSVDEREYYHDPFWGNMSVAKPLQLNVTPNELTINVKGLPSPRPANYSGGVGDFKLTSTLPSQNFLSNQAASIVYTVTGTGNLKYVKLPDLNALYPPELEVYSPTPDVNAEVGSTNVSGSARFDYSFMPLESGNYTIPSVNLVYFNPATGTYETSTAHGFNINVGKGKGSEKSQTRSQLAFNPELMKINDNLKFEHSPYVKKFSYWLFFILPVLILIGISVYYRAYIKANSDLLAVKSRKASKVARMRLRKAAYCMKKGAKEDFYDEMLSAMWGYLGDKLRMPTSELTRNNVSEELESQGIDNISIQRIISLLDDCEFAKYAPSTYTKDMKTVYEEGAEVINNLEEEFKNNKTTDSNEA